MAEKHTAGHVDVNQAWQATADDNADDNSDLWSLEQAPTRVERSGLVVSIVVIIAALFLLALWADSQSSFGQCVALADVDARLACYEKVRQQEFRPPAKGAGMPAALSR